MTTPLPPGLYEALISADLEAAVAAVEQCLVVERQAMAAAEAPDRIALHLTGVIERVVRAMPEKDRARNGVALARALIERIGGWIVDADVAGADIAGDAPIDSGEVLRSIMTRRPDGSPEVIDRPRIPLVDTTLLTNAPGEPRVGHQVGAEIASAQRIDVLIAFVRRTGLNPLTEALRRHCERGRPLRVLTTTYTGSTEGSALDLLVELGAEVRVSYDSSSTRLHAKAWLFHRAGGYSTAYIGSSNLTFSAQVAGMEWNLRVSGVRNKDVIDKMRAVFESYWESGDFRAYDRAEFDEQMGRAARSGPRVYLSPVEIRPEPFQERLLEQLALSRLLGHHRNLLVSATGTGKTVMSALRYARLRAELPRARLLFVAHRQEILDQSQATFRHVLRDANFGESWVAGRRPSEFDHVFASIQTLNRADLSNLPSDHFDVVIVDEFHHAAATSYERLLAHVEPRELLGLTATPERADGLPILNWFGDRIAAELRLWDAIDQHFLVPFAYYGIHDGLDLRDVPWRRGRGYDVDGLTKVYTASDAWARRVVKEVVTRVDDLSKMRALGFCVSVDHARYMARIFAAAKIPSVAIWGDSPAEERAGALRALRDGEVRVLFSVDLFNEGVDLPAVDTVLFLRPTDSPTLFLQQLGRGLRRARNKTVCTVLDFVGHHRREFRYDRRLRALFGGTRKDVEDHVVGKFPFLPAGCHMELDRVASEIVLESIRSSVPSKWTQKVQELRELIQSGRPADLRLFLEHSGLDLEDLYSGNRTWSDLCEDAGVETAGAGPAEAKLRRAIGRLLHVDDAVRIEGYRRLLSAEAPPRVTELPDRDRRLCRMLVSQLMSNAIDKSADLDEGLRFLWEHPQVRAEVCAMLGLRAAAIEHVHTEVTDRPELPLLIHARYTRIEILAAFEPSGGAKVAPWQTGVYHQKEANADLFAFTLDKTDGAFSPTTRYRDYAISRDLIHWESQSITRADSPTGLRYQSHVERGGGVMLFARMRQRDRAFWFLGPATYVSHEGERPMAIKWRLRVPLPGDLFVSFAAAVA